MCLRGLKACLQLEEPRQLLLQKQKFEIKKRFPNGTRKVCEAAFLEIIALFDRNPAKFK